MRITFAFLLLLFLVGCNNETSKTTPSNSGSGSVMQSALMDTCFCQDLDADSLGIYFMKDKKYTGMCIENYPETATKYIEKSLLEGKLHGKVKYFDKQGNVLIEEIFENGNKKRSGEVDVLVCDCSELTLQSSNTPGIPKRYYLDGIPYTGTCMENYPDSKQQYMEVSYEQGVLHGRTKYFNKDGTALYSEKYEKGELISTHY